MCKVNEHIKIIYRFFEEMYRKAELKKKEQAKPDIPLADIEYHGDDPDEWDR